MPEVEQSGMERDVILAVHETLQLEQKFLSQLDERFFLFGLFAFHFTSVPTG